MGYAFYSLLFAALFAVCAHLLGLGLLAGLGAGRVRTGPAPGLLAIPTGTGVLAVLLFVLAALDALRPFAIAATLLAALAAAAYGLRAHGPVGADRIPDRPLGPWLRATAGLLGGAAVLLAMSAPLEWDELAYHLPYARDYAAAGGLVVSEHLRFPLHSHNFQLLYAAALLFAHEPAAHLLHALSGAMVAIGMFAFASHHFGRPAASLAVILYCTFAGSLLDTAYVDLGLTLFVFYAFYALTLWQQSRNDAFLILAAFLLAMAVGTKYQALAQLPAFALALAVAARGAGLRPAIRATAVFLLFGCWWYLRNWLIAGDPVHPLGAEWFGYWLWDEGDLAGQVADIGRYRDHLPPELLPALGFLALRSKRDPAVRSLLIVGLAGLAAWYVSSRYDRYLLPTYPFLAILSAQVAVVAVRRLATLGPFRPLARIAPGRATAALPLAAIVILAAVLVRTVGAKWDEICFTKACVSRVQAERFATPAAARAVPGFTGLRLLQLGLEDELYLMGDATAGDWFGPYRYRDVLALAGDAAALRRHLLHLGRDSLLVNRERPPFSEFSRTFAPEQAFEKLYEDRRVTLYRVRGD